MENKQTILASPIPFICQRPGIDPSDYNSTSDYRADCRAATKDRADALEMLAIISTTDGISGDAILARANKRLTYSERSGWSYVAGQYWSTEYRNAACQLMRDVLRDYYGQACRWPVGVSRGTCKRWFQ